MIYVRIRIHPADLRLFDGMSQDNKKNTDASGDIDLGISDFTVFPYRPAHNQEFSLI